MPADTNIVLAATAVCSKARSWYSSMNIRHRQPRLSAEPYRPGQRHRRGASLIRKRPCAASHRVRRRLHDTPHRGALLHAGRTMHTETLRERRTRRLCSGHRERFKHGELYPPTAYTSPIRSNARPFDATAQCMEAAESCPTYFVPLDTTQFTKFYWQIVVRNILVTTTLKYVDDHRAELKKQLRLFSTTSCAVTMHPKPASTP